MHVPTQLLLHLGAAIAVGGVLGMERTYHGRAAGFRTHTLVCLASSVLVFVAVRGGGATQLDAGRMAQGLMTGIGFLGAGVIFRDGLTTRGLTTAASIWVTAALGILVGAGLWWPAVLGAACTFAVLALFRRIETAVPVHHFAEFKLRFPRSSTPAEGEVSALLSLDGLSAFDFSYRLVAAGALFEYAGTLSCSSTERFSLLARRLRDDPRVREFTIDPY